MPNDRGTLRVEHIMGTAISVHLTDPLPEATRERLIEEVFDWLRLVDVRFSTYRTDSEVCRLQRGDLRPEDGSESLRYVLDACARLWRETDGYFDAQATGRLDPSGFVKGWSVQVASDRLVAAGSVNHLVNAGGDIRLRGEREPGRPWRVGIRHPFEEKAVCRVLSGTDLAVATSGVYERGYHVVDPYTGRPAEELVSVTVVGSDLGTADAYATAALAMGEAGLRWLNRLNGYESLVVTADGRLFRSEGLPDADSDGDGGGDPDETLG
jgi:thiamine biosynthesis lipoprotein